MKRKKRSPADTGEVLLGIHPVFEACRAGRRAIHTVFVSKDAVERRWADLVSGNPDLQRIPVKRLDPDQMAAKTKSEMHQGIAADVSPLPISDIDVLFSEGKGENPLVVFVDSVVDPHNLGAIVRTALCCGATGVVVPKDRNATPTPAASRASAGALEHIHFCQVTNLATTLSVFKEHGFWIVGLDASGSSLLQEVDMTGPTGLVIGGEETGIRPLVLKGCDFVARIPQTGLINSLNASVAGGMAIYEAMRQRIATGKTPSGQPTCRNDINI